MATLSHDPDNGQIGHSGAIARPGATQAAGKHLVALTRRQGDGVPEAAGGASSAAAHPALAAGKVTGGGEQPRIPLDSASETAMPGPETPWSRAGVPSEALAWPVAKPGKNPLRGLLARLRGADSGKCPKIAENGKRPAVPANLRPWTWEILPHVRESRDGSPLVRFMDRIAWHMTLPDDRYVLHAERVARRRQSLVARAMVRFAATCAGRPSGSPPWLREDRRGKEE